MSAYAPYLDWIESQSGLMLETLISWANINSGSFNPLGLSHLAQLIHAEFAKPADSATILPAGDFEQIDVHGQTVRIPLGPNIHAVKRPHAPRQVLLAIHMDTVYGLESPFQTVKRLDDQMICGPGVADAKGGLVIMLFALQALERFVLDTGEQRLGWEVIVNSDEEIGSPGSAHLFNEAAQRVQLALLFEPSLPNGALVSSRKGSGNFSVIASGQAAHSGRDFHLGRNAIVAAADVTAELHRLNGRWPELTLNVARIDGGGPSNMVPALAIVRFNIRYTERGHEPEVLSTIREILARISSQTGVELSLHGDFLAPPKSLTPALETMLSQFQTCGHELGLDLVWCPSGGACDGNRLAALGIPNVDTLGVRGGKIHSHDEFTAIESLAERAKLTALYLLHMAAGKMTPPPSEHGQ
ncbi:hydrolase [Planctomicrobium piriforme]|uniref:Glutamate carboxypeptidase n=1 Tax=Planctomicrobium piriforme TaxID=1576369 RepID=A0A1I3G998_9PLAN|nr:hydrolase [Planctomicrobium piriforme]SFI19751.1 glutamate carboxypeptidase [Planctomicrobium piriforme]